MDYGLDLFVGFGFALRGFRLLPALCPVVGRLAESDPPFVLIFLFVAANLAVHTVSGLLDVPSLIDQYGLR